MLKQTIALALLASCSAPNLAVDAPSPAHTPTTPTKHVQPFGGERLGFVEASSQSGRFVALRLFDSGEHPRFGQHGEPDVSTHVVLHDLETGTEERIVDVMAVDPSRNWFLLLQDATVVLLDTSSGLKRELRPIDLEPDANGCMEPRSAAFSPNGARVGWIAPGSTSLRIRDLTTTEEWTVKAKGRLWRAFPDDTGAGATLLEIAHGSAEWPRQETSCVCRWCANFAMSVAFHGWSGPPFVTAHVDGDGERRESEVPRVESPWHGQAGGGCELRPASEEGGVETGPWRWVCP